MERRRRAFLEIADTLAPQSPLWATMGLRQPATEAAYMIFLRRLYERSGLSYQQPESATFDDKTVETVPRSTIHGVMNRDRLPKREGQNRDPHIIPIRKRPIDAGSHSQFPPIAFQGNFHMNTFDPTNYGFLEEEFVPVIGINMDTVAYGSKTASAQQDVQLRLPALTRNILQDIGLKFEKLPFGMSGDGMYVFLPPAMDPIRDAVRDHPDSDVVVLVSDRLHELVDSSGCLPAGFPLSQVDVVMPAKRYTAPAWLWVGPHRQMNAA